MSDTSALLSVASLEKNFGKELVLRKLSFELQRGETILLLGANGSGKSTLLRICAGLSRASGGDARIKGHAPMQAAKALGYVSHQPLLYADLTVRENIKLHADLFETHKETTDRLLSEWGLAHLAQKRLCEISKGNLARAALARAFVSHPELLLFDEPSAALDEDGALILRNKIKEQVTRGGSLIVTHDLERISSVATRVLVLKEGVISSDASGNEAIQRTIAEYRKINR